MSFVAQAFSPKKSEPAPAPVAAPAPAQKVDDSGDAVRKAKAASGRASTNVTGAGGVADNARVLKTTLGS